MKQPQYKTHKAATYRLPASLIESISDAAHSMRIPVNQFVIVALSAAVIETMKERGKS